MALVEARHRASRRRVAAPRHRPVAPARAVQRSDTIEGYTVGGCQDAVATRVLQPSQGVPPGLRTHPLKALRFMLRDCDLGNWSDRRRSDQVRAHDADPYRLVRA